MSTSNLPTNVPATLTSAITTNYSIAGLPTFAIALRSVKSILSMSANLIQAILRRALISKYRNDVTDPGRYTIKFIITGALY